MTNQNIIDLARFRTNTNSQTASNTNLFLSLNERHRQLWLALQDTREDYGGEISTTNLVQSQQEYPLPDDCMKVKRVELTFDAVNWKRVRFMDINERLRPNDTTSVLNDFSPSEPYTDIHESSLFLFPVPTAAVTNGLKLWYIKRPQDMSLTTDSPLLPKEHHIWIVDLVCLDVEVSRGRLSVIQAEEMASTLLDEFRKLVAPRVLGQKVALRAQQKNYH